MVSKGQNLNKRPKSNLRSSRLRMGGSAKSRTDRAVLKSGLPCSAPLRGALSKAVRFSGSCTSRTRRRATVAVPPMWSAALTVSLDTIFSEYRPCMHTLSLPSPKPGRLTSFGAQRPTRSLLTRHASGETCTAAAPGFLHRCSRIYVQVKSGSLGLGVSWGTRSISEHPFLRAGRGMPCGAGKACAWVHVKGLTSPP
jgi:hypothetical protein